MKKKTIVGWALASLVASTSMTKSWIGLFRFASQKLLLARRDIYIISKCLVGRSCGAMLNGGKVGWDMTDL